jgi:hypothetical protein
MITVEFSEEDRVRMDRLSEALEGASGVADSKAPADKKSGGKKAAAKKADGLGVDEVRKRLKALANIDGSKVAIKILKDHGAASIGELDEDKYADIIAAVDKIESARDEEGEGALD